MKYLKKLLVGRNIGSWTRTLLGLAGAWLLGHGATEVAGAGGAGLDTWIELVSGLFAVGGYAALKVIDGRAFGGKLGDLIGPRVPDLAHSLGRLVLTVVNGALVGMGGIGELTETGDAATWLAAAAMYFLDRLWSSNK